MQVFENRYVRLALLALTIGLVLWALFAIVIMILGLEVPVMLQLMVSFLASGLLVSRFLSNRIF